MSKAERADRLFIEQVRQLTEQMIPGTSASLINSLILSFVLWGIIAEYKIILWFFSVLTIFLIHLLLHHKYQRPTSNPGKITRQRNNILISMAVTGIIWGSAGVFLFPSASIAHQSFIAFVLGGMVAGSVGAFSVFKSAFIAFSVPSLLPIIIMLLKTNDQMHYAMGAMIGLFWFIMFITVGRLNKEVTRSLNLKHENLDLISDLENEINERKNAEQKLLRRNQQIEEIVQYRTSDLQKANKKLTTEIEERKQVEKALYESREKYRDLANTLPQIVFEADERGTLTYVNPIAFEFFGYTESDFNRGLNIFQMLKDKDRDRVTAIIHRLQSGLKSNGNEYRALRKDGTTFPIALHASPIIRENKFMGINGIVIDLTEQKVAEEEKKRLETQLLRAQKMEAIGTLAGGVAHDLNNILSGIVSYPELLLMQIPPDSPLKKPILTMQNSGIKAAAIVQDLLTLTRRGAVNKEVLNLNNIITEYLESPEYEKMISFHNRVQVETDLETDLLFVSGSSIHLMKTVMNLVSNAAEALPDGGTIHISTRNSYVDQPIEGYDDIAEGDYVVLTVSDNGIGIDKKDLERIFEPFFTKKDMGRSGTGLGMTVVWGTVKDHNGYIDVQSIKDKGSTFILYLPVTRKKLASDTHLLATNELMAKGESILVVDDIEEQREIAYALLCQLGYSVITVSSGEEALEYLKKNRVDLLVLDMIMEPNIDGLETYMRILEIYPGQKAVIASGYSETGRVKEAQRLGAGTYVRKPYTLDKIGSAVRNELDK